VNSARLPDVWAALDNPNSLARIDLTAGSSSSRLSELGYLWQSHSEMRSPQELSIFLSSRFSPVVQIMDTASLSLWRTRHAMFFEWRRIVVPSSATHAAEGLGQSRMARNRKQATRAYLFAYRSGEEATGGRVKQIPACFASYWPCNRGVIVGRICLSSLWS
jgi:hypothetical protein